MYVLLLPQTQTRSRPRKGRASAQTASRDEQLAGLQRSLWKFTSGTPWERSSTSWLSATSTSIRSGHEQRGAQQHAKSYVRTATTSTIWTVESYEEYEIRLIRTTFSCWFFSLSGYTIVYAGALLACPHKSSGYLILYAYIGVHSFLGASF